MYFSGSGRRIPCFSVLPPVPTLLWKDLRCVTMPSWAWVSEVAVMNIVTVEWGSQKFGTWTLGSEACAVSMVLSDWEVSVLEELCVAALRVLVLQDFVMLYGWRKKIDLWALLKYRWSENLEAWTRTFVELNPANIKLDGSFPGSSLEQSCNNKPGESLTQATVANKSSPHLPIDTLKTIHKLKCL